MEEYFEEYKEKYPKLKRASEKIWEKIERLIKKIDESQSVLELTEKIENEIKKLGFELAFPLNIGINEVAAHFTPLPNDTLKIKEGDLIKIDFGIHIDGFIFDTAKTFSIGKNELNEKLMKAAIKGLEESLKVIKSGNKVNEVGEVIEEVAKEFDLKPIRNLGGHSLGKYKIHLEPTILNGKNPNDFEFVSGMPIAMEVFMTNGLGFVKESFPGRIYEIIDFSKKNYLRDFKARKIAEKIYQERKTLPFCERWLKDFPLLSVKYFIAKGVEIDLLHEYGILKEAENGKIAQFETTIIVE